MDESYIVYVKPNSEGYITSVNSSEFLSDLTGWVEIDSGYGDKYLHAMGNYFPQSLMTDKEAYRYMLVGGKVEECTAEDIARQEAANEPGPAPVPGDTTSVWDELDAAYREGVDSV